MADDARERACPTYVSSSSARCEHNLSDMYHIVCRMTCSTRRVRSPSSLTVRAACVQNVYEILFSVLASSACVRVCVSAHQAHTIRTYLFNKHIIRMRAMPAHDDANDASDAGDEQTTTSIFPVAAPFRISCIVYYTCRRRAHKLVGVGASAARFAPSLPTFPSPGEILLHPHPPPNPQRRETSSSYRDAWVVDVWMRVVVGLVVACCCARIASCSSPHSSARARQH